LYRSVKNNLIHSFQHVITMANPNAGHFFQTSDSLVSEERKAAKAKNKLGRPIKLSSKLLAVTPDPFDERAVYVAEAAGEVRRVVLEVSNT
jgi:hypothetical protein